MRGQRRGNERQRDGRRRAGAPDLQRIIDSVRDAVGSRARIVHVPGATLPVFSRVLGLVLHDVLLTREEYTTMARGMADTDGPTTGQTALSTWLDAHRSDLGLRYANELERHFEGTDTRSR